MILALRVAFMVLLYLFLFSLVGVVRRELTGTAASTVSEQAPPGRLIVLEAGDSGLASGRSLGLAPVTIVGRGADSQIRLNGAFVSSQHAKLRWSGGRWKLADVGSTNGTLLNEVPLEGEVSVAYGDVIGIGDVRLKLAR